MNNFSFFNRANCKQELKTTAFDLLIIGGGITGAGIALDAASRGMKVALAEKDDFASGTSSKSTKLIHGGLRYLKQFDFWLVKEVGTERALVHKLAPHLVIPEKMILPLVEGGTYGSWLTSIGLKIYDILASVEGDDKRKMLNKKEALEKEPLLPEDILTGAGFYAEYRTDDARLTLEILKTAHNYKAQILNYAKIEDFVYKNKQVTGAKLCDVLSGDSFYVNAKYVVNATGPWVDELRRINYDKTTKRLHLTKGVHLVVSHEKLPIKQAVYFDAPDGRMIFAIPRGKATYFGTTDTNYQQDKNRVICTAEDALYLINAVNNMFPNITLHLDDIQSSWAGLRPLIHEEGKSASELSRKDEIFVSNTKLISIAGGKLTGYRKMAERIVNLVAKKINRKFEMNFISAQTDKIVLTGGFFKNYQEVKNYCNEVYSRIKPFGFNMQQAHYLVHNYGKQTQSILKKFDELNDVNFEKRLLKAEIWFAVHCEMVYTPSDFFIRRTGRLYFDKASVNKYKKLIIKELSLYFNWNDALTDKYQKELETNIKQTVSFINSVALGEQKNQS
ncbi:MAG: glycerol-3-phosphate dehydrogenase/oxidase [Tenacibaculum sp.]